MPARLKEDYVVRELPSGVNFSIGYLLGYDALPTGSIIASNTPIGAVMVNILETQQLISESRVDAMAVSVGDLTLDYTSFLGRLVAQGSQQVKVLSAMTGIPINVDIFTGTIPKSGSNPYQVKSTPFLAERYLGFNGGLYHGY
jgi:hypothetical protein